MPNEPRYQTPWPLSGEFEPGTDDAWLGGIRSLAGTKEEPGKEKHNLKKARRNEPTKKDLRARIVSSGIESLLEIVRSSPETSILPHIRVNPVLRHLRRKKQIRESPCWSEDDKANNLRVRHQCSLSA
jgi:hypothetical protein